MLINNGECSIDSINDANIPVNIFIGENKEDGDKYSEYKYYLIADNFCPRRQVLYDASYQLEANSIEEFKPFLEKTKSLYQCALNRIEQMIKGKAEYLYYWNDDENNITPIPQV